LPLTGSLFRSNSRLIVDGERPSSFAIDCIDIPAPRKSAITIRSSTGRKRAEMTAGGGALIGG